MAVTFKTVHWKCSVWRQSNLCRDSNICKLLFKMQNPISLAQNIKRREMDSLILVLAWFKYGSAYLSVILEFVLKVSQSVRGDAEFFKEMLWMFWVKLTTGQVATALSSALSGLWHMPSRGHTPSVVHAHLCYWHKPKVLFLRGRCKPRVVLRTKHMSLCCQT